MSASGVEGDLERLSLEEVEVLIRIADILRGLRYGSVLVVVQDGEVVQIEASEKIRLR